MSTGHLRNIKIEGLGLTGDFLELLADRSKARSTIDPESYGLAPREPVEEAISRSWDRLRKAYARWTEARAGKGQPDMRRAWLEPLWQELGHHHLQANPLPTIEDKTYPLSFLGTVPIQVAPGEDLDRIGQHGSVRASAHGLVQEFLNRSDAYLWGIVTNGEKLRLLRDNVQVTRPAYLQFDLEEIFDQGDSAAFRLLWLLAHQSRFEGGKDAPIERWSQQADEQGTRANDALRDGVTRAIEALGAGFVRRNKSLRDRLSSGDLKALDLYRLSLKIVYQLVFLFVIEDRDLLHGPDSDPLALERYRHYSSKRLRQIAQATEGSRQHADAWQGLRFLLRGMYAGLPFIGVPAFGGHLFQPHELLDLELGNSDLYAAIKAMSEIEQDRTLKTINYAGLDAEELGSIYESLLELHPQIDTATGQFTLGTAAGNERKTTGSYYTPGGLIELLLESALDPVIESAQAKADPVAALKSLKVIDPACGSGHFLLAAARRIGLALARTQHGVTHPSPDQLREAVRTVIAHCIYGVDINPMAIELCRVALWLESAVPGKPLAFLDHRLKVGNSLLGTTPDLMNVEEILKDKGKNRTTDKETVVRVLGLPDDAFTALEGDDKKTVSQLKKDNKAERNQQAVIAQGQPLLFGGLEDLTPLRRMVEALDRIEPDSFDSTRAQESTFQAIQQHDHLTRQKLLADAWCSAFVNLKVPGAPSITTRTLHALKTNPNSESLEPVRQVIADAARQYKFMHPHVEFPDVFTGAEGGFDCVLGNPPWERIKLQEKEWFAQRVPEIAQAANAAARTRKINELKADSPAIYAAFKADLRQAEGESHFIRSSGKYPLTGRGDVNTYAVFSEANRDSLNPHGRMGIIVPTGIATDDTTKFFFQDLMEKKSLVSLYDFRNNGFFDIAGAQGNRFCLITTSNLEDVEHATFAFKLMSTSEIKERSFSISDSEIALLNPNTRTAPVFRSARDARITKQIYQRVPVLLNEATAENPWGISFMRMFDMSNDAGLFHTADQLQAEGWMLDGNRYRKGTAEMLPLYEAKMMHQYEHRFGDYALATIVEGKGVRQIPQAESKILERPDYHVSPRYYLSKESVLKRSQHKNYFLSFRDIASGIDERTMICSILPESAVGHKAPLILPEHPCKEALYPNLNSFVFDYIARQKIGGVNMTYFILKQLPVLPPSTFTPQLLQFITPRVLELTYTAHDLKGFAEDLDYHGQPFVWNDERRFIMRAELDALYFHLYGIERDDVDYIMDTFPIVKRKDEARYGSYRTKEEILSIYDEIAQVGVENYRSRLPIPPADARAAHGYVGVTPPNIRFIPQVEEYPAAKQAIIQALAKTGYDFLHEPEKQRELVEQAAFDSQDQVRYWLDVIEDMKNDLSHAARRP